MYCTYRAFSRDRFPVVSLEIFYVVPSTEPCALRSTQPLKVSTRDFSWGEGGRCVWLTTYHPCSAESSTKSGALTYPEPLVPPRPVAGDLYFTFTMHFLQVNVRANKRTTYTGCPRRNVPNFGRVFLMLKYTDITQNTYVQS